MFIGKFRQFLAAIASSFAGFMMGLLNAWPSYTSEIYLSNTTTPLSSVMTATEEAMLGSLPSLGAMLGTSIAGVMINKLGRRNGGIVLSLPVLVSWVMINTTTSIKLVLVARFVGGFSGGASLVLSPILVSEVAEDSIRGLLASASVYLYSGGILLSYVTGYFMTYRTIIWLNIVLSAAGLILLALITESPVYLLKQKREEDAKLSIAKYRGLPVSSMAVLEEIVKLKQEVEMNVELLPVADIQDTEKKILSLEEMELQKAKSMSTLKLLFLHPTSRRAFIVLTTVITIQVFMGSVPMQVYAKMVFLQTDPSNADIYTMVYAALLFFGSVVTALFTDKYGRKSLLVSSSVLVFLCMTVLGYLVQFKVGPPIVIVLLIFSYSFCYVYGAGTVPYVLLAEIFIVEVQNLASFLIIEWIWFLNFVIIAVFPFLSNTFGIYGTFYIFGFMGLANAILSYLIVPETKGLSHSQIQELFRSGKKI